MPVAQEHEQDPADTAVTQVISAAFQLWNCPVHPFFAEMPDWFVLRSSEIPRLGPIALTLGLLQEETQRPSLGSETIVQGLLDTVFTYLLREMAHRFSHGGMTVWSHAALDPQISKVLSLLHTHCEAGWTLDKLASEVGVSRTSLAERFRNAMGDTPLNYLRTLRIQKAMRLLGDTDWSLETIAGRVGYQDAFSFSKVFKRVTGSSPSNFRNRDRQEQQLDWRFRPT